MRCSTFSSLIGPTVGKCGVELGWLRLLSLLEVPKVDSPSGVKLPGKDGSRSSNPLDLLTSRLESNSLSKNKQSLFCSWVSSKSGGVLCVQYTIIYRGEWSGLILLNT